jgi:uncharacterized membrane protein YgdD (TMEM256/DUF423 family)
MAALLGALGVLIGAMGTHIFVDTLVFEKAVYFEKAWRYHMIHVFALLFCSWLIWVFDHGLETHGSWSAKLAAVFFLVGILLFSGVLYLQALAGGQPRIPLVPVGGMSFILGWVMIMVSGFRIPRF